MHGQLATGRRLDVPAEHGFLVRLGINDGDASQPVRLGFIHGLRGKEVCAERKQAAQNPEEFHARDSISPTHRGQRRSNAVRRRGIIGQKAVEQKACVSFRTVTGRLTQRACGAGLP